MSCSSGPKIAKDSSLIFNTDFANIKNYSAANDPYRDSVSLLLDFEGDFTDKSKNNRTVTANGSASISSSQYKYGSSSLYLDGSNSYLTVSGDFSQTGDFTLECWIYVTNTAGVKIICCIGNEASERGSLYLTGSTLGYDTYSTGTPDFTGGTVSANVWNHVALVRSGTAVTLYLNGTSVGTGSKSGTLGNSSGLSIGSTNPTDANDFSGYVDDFCLTSYARYTSNFTPPSKRDLPARSVDLKNKNVGVITSGTFSSANQGLMAFNGTNTKIYYPSNTSYSFGTGDFTIESFCQINAATTVKPIAQNDAVGTSQNDKWWLAYDSSVAGLRLGRHFTSTYSSCSWSPTSGTWYHIAATRISGSTYFYINGISQSVTNQTSLNGISFSQNGLSIGAISTPYYLNGNIALLRIYNRGLSSIEVYNNYIADRGRFSL